ncbi:hypothetical protein [Runella sp.]|jgi:hypothetical protein|uniref:hypothetical protein n=1 Tax=Runella sp. TaxID=1960881 RepID=UPI0030177FB9
MGSILEKINEIITPEFRLEIATTAIILPDNDPQGTCENITLNINGRLLACKFDRKSIINFPFFIPGEAHEMCDYLLFYESNNKPDLLYIFVCELQSRSKPDKKAISQMQAGYNLASFLIQTACKILNYENNHKVIFKGIRFSTRPPQKVFNFSASREAWKILIPNTDIRYLEVLCGEPYYIEDNFM